MKKFIVLFAIVATAVASKEANLKKFKSGTNLLTSDIYKELSKTSSENFLVSPFSVETVLALTQSGAKDGTAEEVRKSLHLPNQKQTEKIFSDVLPLLQSEHYYTLHSANIIYVRENFPVRQEFLKVANQVYQARCQNIDFTKKETAVREINRWVASQTNDKIHDIVSSGDLNDYTALILINALYFKGEFSDPFNAYKTSPNKFYSKKKQVLTVDTMHAFDYYNFYESSKLKAKFLQLPFKGNNASLVIVLPNQKNGISSLEKKIDEVFKPHPFTLKTVQVALPKFKIENSIDFVPISEKLGIRKIFDRSEADFSGIAGQKGDLVVSSILQKTFIDVNEGGAEAAAATVVEMETLSAVYPNKLFIADHPFIFYIQVKDVVLFAGRVLVPNQ